MHSSSRISSWSRQNGYRFLHSRQPSNLWVLQSFICSSSVWSRPIATQLFFKDILRPREDIGEVLEASKVFKLGSDLPSLCLHDWIRVILFSTLFDSWWQKWRSHLFCGPVHPLCIALDGEFASDSKVTFYSLFREITWWILLPTVRTDPFRILNSILQVWIGKGIL